MRERIQLTIRKDIGPIPTRRRGPFEDTRIDGFVISRSAFTVEGLTDATVLCRDDRSDGVAQVRLAGEILRGTMPRAGKRNPVKTVGLSGWRHQQGERVRGSTSLSKRETLIVEVLTELD